MYQMWHALSLPAKTMRIQLITSCCCLGKHPCGVLLGASQAALVEASGLSTEEHLAVPTGKNSVC